MKQQENILGVSAVQPNYMGFIFYEKTPRNFEGEIPPISSEIKKTGVFVDASVDFISEKVQKYELKAIQLHGSESPEFCRELKENISGVKPELIKVFSIKDEFDFSILKEYEGLVDFFLFDTKGKTKGGTGKTFNWEVLKEYPSSTPFFLSGGIGLEEVEELQKLLSHFRKNGKGNLIYAIDVNSRFEIAPGVKNIAKLKQFRNKLLEK